MDSSGTESIRTNKKLIYGFLMLFAVGILVTVSVVVLQLMESADEREELISSGWTEEYLLFHETDYYEDIGYTGRTMKHWRKREVRISTSSCTGDIVSLSDKGELVYSGTNYENLIDTEVVLQIQGTDVYTYKPGRGLIIKCLVSPEKDEIRFESYSASVDLGLAEE